MKVGLFDFQKDARDDLHDRLKRVRAYAAVENPQVVVPRGRKDNSHDRFI